MTQTIKSPQCNGGALRARSARRKITGRQRNHGDYYLPENISHLQEPTFYMAVAWWGLLIGRPFTRDDVANAFRVTARRAADVMTYLATGVSRSIVKLEKDVVLVESGRMVLRMTILSVDERPAGEGRDAPPGDKAAGTPARHRHRGAAAEGLQAARDLFLRGRRSPPSKA